MKNKKQQKRNQNLAENTYSEDYDDAIFAVAESVSGKTFTEKRRKVEAHYDRLTAFYYDEFDSLIFKIGVAIFFGLITLAAIFIGVAIYHNSELWIMITSIFFGAFGGGLLCFLFATGLRFLLFNANYNSIKRLYSSVKSFAEKSLGLPIKLDYSADDIMNGYYTCGFAESDSVKEKLTNL